MQFFGLTSAIIQYGVRRTKQESNWNKYREKEIRDREKWRKDRARFM